MDFTEDAPPLPYKRRSSILKQTRHTTTENFSELDTNQWQLTLNREEFPRALTNDVSRSQRRVSFSSEVKQCVYMVPTPSQDSKFSPLRSSGQRSQAMELIEQRTVNWYKPGFDVGKTILEKQAMISHIEPPANVFGAAPKPHTSGSSEDVELNRTIYFPADEAEMELSFSTTELPNKSIYFKSGFNDMSMTACEDASLVEPDEAGREAEDDVFDKENEAPLLEPQPSDMSFASINEHSSLIQVGGTTQLLAQKKTFSNSQIFNNVNQMFPNIYKQQNNSSFKQIQSENADENSSLIVQQLNSSFRQVLTTKIVQQASSSMQIEEDFPRESSLTEFIVGKSFNEHNRQVVQTGSVLRDFKPAINSQSNVILTKHDQQENTFSEQKEAEFGSETILKDVQPGNSSFRNIQTQVMSQTVSENIQETPTPQTAVVVPCETPSKSVQRQDSYLKTSRTGISAESSFRDIQQLNSSVRMNDSTRAQPVTTFGEQNLPEIESQALFKYPELASSSSKKAEGRMNTGTIQIPNEIQSGSVLRSFGTEISCRGLLKERGQANSFSNKQAEGRIDSGTGTFKVPIEIPLHRAATKIQCESLSMDCELANSSSRETEGRINTGTIQIQNEITPGSVLHLAGTEISCKGSFDDRGHAISSSNLAEERMDTGTCKMPNEIPHGTFAHPAETKIQCVSLLMDCEQTNSSSKKTGTISKNPIPTEIPFDKPADSFHELTAMEIQCKSSSTDKQLEQIYTLGKCLTDENQIVATEERSDFVFDASKSSIFLAEKQKTQQNVVQSTNFLTNITMPQIEADLTRRDVVDAGEQQEENYENLMDISYPENSFDSVQTKSHVTEMKTIVEVDDKPNVDVESMKQADEMVRRSRRLTYILDQLNLTKVDEKTFVKSGNTDGEKLSEDLENVPQQQNEKMFTNSENEDVENSDQPPLEAKPCEIDVVPADKSEEKVDLESPASDKQNTEESTAAKRPIADPRLASPQQPTVKKSKVVIPTKIPVSALGSHEKRCSRLLLSSSKIKSKPPSKTSTYKPSSVRKETGKPQVECTPSNDWRPESTPNTDITPCTSTKDVRPNVTPSTLPKDLGTNSKPCTSTTDSGPFITPSTSTKDFKLNGKPSTSTKDLRPEITPRTSTKDLKTSSKSSTSTKDSRPEITPRTSSKDLRANIKPSTSTKDLGPKCKSSSSTEDMRPDITPSTSNKELRTINKPSTSTEDLRPDITPRISTSTSTKNLRSDSNSSSSTKDLKPDITPGISSNNLRSKSKPSTVTKEPDNEPSTSTDDLKPDNAAKTVPKISAPEFAPTRDGTSNAVEPSACQPNKVDEMAVDAEAVSVQIESTRKRVAADSLSTTDCVIQQKFPRVMQMKELIRGQERRKEETLINFNDEFFQKLEAENFEREKRINDRSVELKEMHAVCDEMQKRLDRSGKAILKNLAKEETFLIKSFLASCSEPNLMEVEVKVWSRSKVIVSLWKSTIKLKLKLGDKVDKPITGPWNTIDNRTVLSIRKFFSTESANGDVMKEEAQQMLWKAVENMDHLFNASKTTHDFMEVLKLLGDYVIRSKFFYLDLEWVKSSHSLELVGERAAVGFVNKVTNEQFSLSIKVNLDMYSNNGPGVVNDESAPVTVRGKVSELDVRRVTSSVSTGKSFLRKIVSAVDDWIFVSNRYK